MIESLQPVRERYVYLFLAELSRGFPASVSIPQIRHVMPKMVAYDLCGVQPMSADFGSVFSLRLKQND